MKETVTATEAARSLGELLARVTHAGDTFVVTRNDRPVAEITAVPGLSRGTLGAVRQALAALPADPAFADDLEAVNARDTVPAPPWPSSSTPPR